MDESDCSIAATVRIIGDRWTLLILRDAFRGIRRFDEFHHDLGIARNLLTDRLARLVEHGIFEKVAYQERPARFEYRLTRKGIELSPSLVALMKWGDTWMAGDSGPPVVLVHDECATAVDQVFHCPACEVDVTPLQLRNRDLRHRSQPSHTTTEPTAAASRSMSADLFDEPEPDHAHVAHASVARRPHVAGASRGR
jgi:DNA-binding HxlR family transcriptional regulator